jgi:hypothetical protein
MECGRNQDQPGIPATVLVRRAGPEAAHAAVALLGEWGLARAELAACAAEGGLFVAEDVASRQPLEAVAVAAFRVDRASRRARLLALGLRKLEPGGLIQRLMTGAAMLMRADGVEAIEAAIGAGVPDERVLLESGFGETGGTHLLYLW